MRDGKCRPVQEGWFSGLIEDRWQPVEYEWFIYVSGWNEPRMQILSYPFNTDRCSVHRDTGNSGTLLQVMLLLARVQLAWITRMLEMRKRYENKKHDSGWISGRYSKERLEQGCMDYIEVIDIFTNFLCLYKNKNIFGLYHERATDVTFKLHMTLESQMWCQNQLSR